MDHHPGWFLRPPGGGRGPLGPLHGGRRRHHGGAGPPAGVAPGPPALSVEFGWVFKPDTHPNSTESGRQGVPQSSANMSGTDSSPVTVP
ncbi:hypothetical protein ACFFX0_19515 [Citricoccus parietis]|uniref:Uncharacterized protein n=1 Tax=Citricoccus parietis TaxID=592307 RepID=A0ABV5G2W0_9MICC